VSFTGTNRIRHAVEVAASTLCEAATLAMAGFRQCGFKENARSRTRDAAHRDREGASTAHKFQWGKVETWLQSAGKPNEQV
jgi:hypothetical protein